MTKKKFSGFGVGLPSILMIFVVLALTVFAVLGYLSAKADTKLTNKKTEYIKQYQSADSKANEKLYELDEKLLEACEEDIHKKDFEEFFKKTGFNFTNDVLPYVEYSIEINKNQSLYVKVEINIDESGEIVNNDRYKIKEWRTKSNVFDKN